MIPDNPDELLALMRREGLEITHSLYASIHDTADELDEISDDLQSGDVARWKRELAAHFAEKNKGG